MERILVRMARWALDFTLDFAPGVMLRGGVSWGGVGLGGLGEGVLFLEHCGGCVCVCVGVERAWFVAWWDGGDGCWCPAVRACVVEGQPCAERNIDLPT